MQHEERAIFARMSLPLVEICHGSVIKQRLSRYCIGSHREACLRQVQCLAKVFIFRVIAATQMAKLLLHSGRNKCVAPSKKRRRAPPQGPPHRGILVLIVTSIELYEHALAMITLALIVLAFATGLDGEVSSYGSNVLLFL